MRPSDFQNIFRFKPLRTAKVSEISEATAASSVPAEERINFHIGNPVQDARLQQMYFEMVLQNQANSDWPHRDFIFNTIGKASPYAPRGGYLSRSPHPLVKQVQKWSSEKQSDALHYFIGEQNNPREITIGSGGLSEALRVLFFTLSRFQQNQPIYIYHYKIDVPDHLLNFPGLQHIILPEAEPDFLVQLNNNLQKYPQQPHYLLMGSAGSENLRRELRLVSQDNPIFFVEAFDTENDISLAREAQLTNRVLRFCSSRILNSTFDSDSILFFFGPSELMQLLETVHFELKGTPSAPEIELVTYLTDGANSSFIEQNPEIVNNEIKTQPVLPAAEQLLQGKTDLIEKTAQKVQELQQKSAQILEQKLERNNNLLARLHPVTAADSFADKNPAILTEQLFRFKSSSEYTEALEQNMLSAFLKHHTFYDYNACTVVSGSARTALSLLGFHCGISEVVSVDLSWTYQHCFPKVEIIPLKDDLNIDTAALLKFVQNKIQKSGSWLQNGAVVLNNPHNATGKVFPEKNLKELLRELLRLNVRIIDDLSYQNVSPAAKHGHIKTLKELVKELVRDGYVTREESTRLITVHSLSKTDSLAGARLAITEIAETDLRARFKTINATISKNAMSILLAYLFYRNSNDLVSAFWQLRNDIFTERMRAIKQAAKNLPAERNPFEIKIHAPEGSMYPRMEIGKLPDSLSLDWLATQLATEGTGLIPLTTFAKTAAGYQVARTSFRLTLGGSANIQKLGAQTRRMLIELNRLLALESAKYSLKSVAPLKTRNPNKELPESWQQRLQHIEQMAIDAFSESGKLNTPEEQNYLEIFKNEFLKFRLNIFKERLTAKHRQNEFLFSLPAEEIRQRLLPRLEYEFYKEDLNTRKTHFKRRLFDRTVHPTQMYALQVDVLFKQLLDSGNQKEQQKISKKLAMALCQEFNGKNISITSVQESDELLLDLYLFGQTELQLSLADNSTEPFMLSFWGDWDGSTRPSGQGHRLVAAVLLENIRQMAAIIELINSNYPNIKIDEQLLQRIRRQPQKNQDLRDLFDRITHLTAQLEKRHRNLVRLDLPESKLAHLARRMHLVKDPIELQWQHNDRLERKMKSLRLKRKQELEAAFRLNKQLRKTLYQLLPQLKPVLHEPVLLESLANYRDLLKRFVLTPRIHQKMITSDDSFAIDTTVFNLNEINEIGAAHGNPGLILGLQISMSTGPEALIDLERKLSSRREAIMQDNQNLPVPAVWPIPLFEDSNSVSNIENYLDSIWAYAERTRALNQDTSERLTDILCEVFFAGSDLSQQVSQAKAAELYAQAKYKVYKWLGSKGIASQIRVKLGSGEPMQRQGGYYDNRSGQPAFISDTQIDTLLKKHLSPPDHLSTRYATSPLRGVLAGGDLRTFQSNLMEHVRLLSISQRAALLKQVKSNQQQLSEDIIALSEPLTQTRLQVKTNAHKALKLLCAVGEDVNYQRFLTIYSDLFRNILYGNDEDVLGVHIISYFISRAIPTLRDRPTVRPTTDSGRQSGRKVVDRIAQTLPLSQHGTMLRAIGHSRAQTMILGISQLSTGLFRAIDKFLSLADLPADPELLLRNNILPRLPVYDILHNIRLFQDAELNYFSHFDSLFPNWNSAIIALREDRDLMRKYIPSLQKEFVRRLGLNTNAFFEGGLFKAELLTTMQPDLAVLLQKDIFNRDEQVFVESFSFTPNANWMRQVSELLQVPQKISTWRENIWQLIREPIFEQVKSFNKLAYAITSLTQTQSGNEVLPAALQGKISQVSSVITKSLFAESDDRMKEFLENSVKYLSGLQAQSQEVPISVIRALRDVQRILKIEQQPLPPAQQEQLSFYILQVARLAGENG